MTQELADAWRVAAEDLGIDVIAPFLLLDELTQRSASCIALIKWFGSPSGTVVVARHSPSEIAQSAAKARGMFVSMLDERSFAKYSRDLFVDTLNDWGWYGPEYGSPQWFSGQPWTA